MAHEQEKTTEEELKRRREQIETRMVDVGRESAEEAPLPRGVKSWMEKIEKAPKLGGVNLKSGQGAGLKPAAPINPKIVLPITRQGLASGFKAQVNMAARWLSTFVFRLIKIKNGEVKFKNDDA